MKNIAKTLDKKEKMKFFNVGVRESLTLLDDEVMRLVTKYLNEFGEQLPEDTGYIIEQGQIVALRFVRHIVATAEERHNKKIK